MYMYICMYVSMDMIKDVGLNSIYLEKKLHTTNTMK